jgi:hypothetical protein
VRRLTFIMLLAIGLACVSRAAACDLPVFRYALEHWPPDNYQAIVFHSGPLGKPEAAVVAGLEKLAADVGAPMNLDVQTVDVSKPDDEESLQLYEALGKPPLPHVAIVYPRVGPTANVTMLRAVVWSNPLSQAAGQGVLTSPVRKEIVRRLRAGESAVWLLLECGDKAKDDAAAKTLTDELAVLQKTLKLPEPQEGNQLAPGAATVAASQKTDLKIAFSVLRVSRGDAAESHFAAMLDKMNGPEVKGPVALPVFGRGRALAMLSGEELSPATIRSVSEFLTGACSCTAKERIRGVDLLLAADWGDLTTDPPVPLTSVMPAATLPATATTRPAIALASGVPLMLVVTLCVLGGAVVVLALVSVLVLRRRRTGS